MVDSFFNKCVRTQKETPNTLMDTHYIPDINHPKTPGISLVKNHTEKGSVVSVRKEEIKKSVYASFKNEMVYIGYVQNDIFYREVHSKHIYRALNSVGLDVATADHLKGLGVETLQTTIKDKGLTYRVPFYDFLKLAKSRHFYGILRLHVPFSYWTLLDESDGSDQDKPQQMSLFLAVDNTLGRIA